MGACHGDTLHWLDLGDGIEFWGYLILAGSMELLHGDTRHWLERAMGLIYGGVWHWLERSDGIDSGGLAMGAHHTGWIRVMD